MPVNLPLILHAVLEDYALPWNGYHGIAHWARVLENGLRLARETGAVIEVVQLFAILHDCRRLNEGFDPEHGHRAAKLARTLRGQVFDLTTITSACCTAPAQAIPTSAPTPTKRSRPAGTPIVSTWAESASRPIPTS